MFVFFLARVTCLLQLIHIFPAFRPIYFLPSAYAYYFAFDFASLGSVAFGITDFAVVVVVILSPSSPWKPHRAITGN
jgi:hypothetical protein